MLPGRSANFKYLVFLFKVFFVIQKEETKMKVMTRKDFVSWFAALLTTVFFAPAAANAAVNWNSSIRFKVKVPGTVLEGTLSKFDCVTKEFSLWGAMVLAIGGCNGNWVCAVNGRWLTKSAALSNVNAGDVIEWHEV
ncbi:hypothetical protein C4572_02480 [Candidatus Parcubacteria bacterium]|nr:MAG: hypothetical protein C4572_02480 [Candidatus Parcubacteria bacterium]